MNDREAGAPAEHDRSESQPAQPAPPAEPRRPEPDREIVYEIQKGGTEQRDTSENFRKS